MSRTTTQRRKSFNQKQRLAAARPWLQAYTGNNVAQAYRKYFGVDWETTIQELEMLGTQFPADFKEMVLKKIDNMVAVQKQKLADKLALEKPDQDENFAYITGYTSGGAAYGITWEEWKQSEIEN